MKKMSIVALLGAMMVAGVANAAEPAFTLNREAHAVSPLDSGLRATAYVESVYRFQGYVAGVDGSMAEVAVAIEPLSQSSDYRCHVRMFAGDGEVKAVVVDDILTVGNTMSRRALFDVGLADNGAVTVEANCRSQVDASIGTSISAQSKAPEMKVSVLSRKPRQYPGPEAGPWTTKGFHFKKSKS